jgi:hypothetical protein
MTIVTEGMGTLIVLINGGPALDRFGPSGLVGRLVSPRSGNKVRPGERWAADNDAFLAWDEGRFRRMLGRLAGRPGCLFVAAPDVVGDAAATLARFAAWRPVIAAAGLPVALVGQDGAEGLAIPWDSLDAWFVGGSTAWKLSAAAADLVAEARARGKWTHMGRVNTRRRLRIAFDFGCDSVDGTGWSMFPDKYLRRDLPYVANLHSQRTIPGFRP